ncbi:hypothetical protein MNB_SV-5-1754 [hydrothermal vent metagenome]|uniref:Methyltransferase domain-containing protein n=1 Tax=hydrothermal vent metagenome TaxID=652676 RepID=A0A1W1EBM5_9ZZZZ
MIFTNQTMQNIIPILQKVLQEKDIISFCVLNPDEADVYAGNIININNTNYIYRGFKSYVDLAELLKCKMLMPKEGEYPLIKLTFKKLETDSSFHKNTAVEKEEKYGVTSTFFDIYKMEEPAFLYYYEEALKNVTLEKRKRILDLGVNRGDELEVIKNMLDINKYKEIDFLGVDHSQSAVEYANSVFTETNSKFISEDINNLDSLNLGEFDLLISIGTLQSPSINFKPFFMNLVQNYLKKDSAIILGFPNSRWLGGEMIYGAKAPNYEMNEMSLLLNDIIFCKKYLQQKKYRVTITGKQYLFLTATKIGVL